MPAELSKIQQKSAFLIEYRMVKVEETKEKRTEHARHQFPLVILSSVQEALDFLSKYTDFLKCCNEDVLAAKWELKEACFSVELTNREQLRKDIMTAWDGSFEKWTDDYYNEHFIHIHRLPLGPQKRQLLPNYY